MKCIKVVNRKIKYFIDGKEVTEAAFNGSVRIKPLDISGDEVEHHTAGYQGYPIKSVALAVTSKQVKSAQEDSVKKGVPTEFTKGGRPILRDAAHRKQYMKAYGYRDLDSYYGY